MRYTVRSGDTLSGVARRFKTSLDELLRLNPGYRGRENVVRVGARLTLPDERTSKPASAGEESTADRAESGFSGAKHAPAEGAGASPHAKAARRKALGSLSVFYETGGLGAAAVSTDCGDAGGTSYGSYQMTSKPGGGTVTRFVRSEAFPWPGAFDGLTAGTPEFTARWKKLVAEHPKKFAEAEHGYIEETHYRRLCASLLKTCGVDVSTRSHALQDVIWSVAVQHGPNNKMVEKAIDTLRKQDPAGLQSDLHLIHAIYDERAQTGKKGELKYFAKNSEEVQQGVRERFVKERSDALALLSDETNDGALA